MDKITMDNPTSRVAVAQYGVLYQEPRKISDILGADAFPTVTRTIKIASGQGQLEIGTILISDETEVYSVANATDLAAKAAFTCVLGEHTQSYLAADPPPSAEVSATAYFSGSFQAKELLTLAADPVDVYSIRSRLLAANLNIEG